MKEVSIYTEDELLGKASLGRPRPDVANHFRSPVYLNSGWEFNGGKLVLKDKINCKDGVILIKVLINGAKSDGTWLVKAMDNGPKVGSAPPGASFREVMQEM